MIGNSNQVFGYAIQISFVGHMCAALFLWQLDTQEHHWTMMLLLFSALLNASIHMARGLWALRSNDIAGHKDHMFRCFVYSIEGAGTIRLSGFLLTLIDADPTVCQAAQAGITGTACVVAYAARLIGTRLLTLYWIGCYVRIKGAREEKKRHLKQTAISAIAMGSVYAYVSTLG